jgi:TPR repeat protein
LYRKAAENGKPEVQIKLANLLFHGEHATANYEEVRRLCEKAANLHFPAGAYCMGHLYEHGFGVEQNLQKAAKWFSDSANMNYGPAALRLGEMYWKGEGIKQDKISAYEFIYLATTSGLLKAQEEKASLEKELSPKEIEKGKGKAVEWTRQHPSMFLKGRPIMVD